MSSTDSDTAFNFQQPLIDMALESWQFAKVCGHILARLDAAEFARYVNPMCFFKAHR